MDVDVMDKLIHDTLNKYFKTLALTGYKSYDVVYKILTMTFIQDLLSTELRYYTENKDLKLMQDLLYQFFGSTCEISFPTSSLCCCNQSNDISTSAPDDNKTYIYIGSNAAKKVLIDNVEYNTRELIEVELGSTVKVVAEDVEGYSFSGLVGFNDEFDMHSDSSQTFNIKCTAQYNMFYLFYSESNEPVTTTTEAPRTTTITFAHDSRSMYIVTYNYTQTITVLADEDRTITLSIPEGVSSASLVINSIICNNANYECYSVGQGTLPVTINYNIGSEIKVTPSISQISTLAYLQIESSKDNYNKYLLGLPDGDFEMDITFSDGGESISCNLENCTTNNNIIVQKSYTGIGGSNNVKVNINWPYLDGSGSGAIDYLVSHFKGWYDTKTGELLSTDLDYSFVTPTNRMTYLTIVLGDATTTIAPSTTTETPYTTENPYNTETP